MPMSTPIAAFSNKPLIPAVGSPKPKELAINIGPSATIAKGTVLQYAGAAANDVQTITMTATAGTFIISGISPLTGPFTTSALAYNIPLSTSSTNLQATLRAAYGLQTTLTVTGTAGSSYVITFVGNLASMPIAPMTLSTGSLNTGGATIAHGTTGQTAGTYVAYTSTGPAVCIAKYDMASDSNGLITLGLTSGGGEWGQSYNSAPAYFSGWFLTSQLVGLDATAISNLGRLLSGTSTSGTLAVYD